MTLNETDISQVVATIWQSVLGIECASAAVIPAHSPASLSACVQITGAWQGAVVVSCAQAFANRAAKIMFNLPVEELAATDAQDAMAELTNMVGGNFKGLLSVPEACQLSLPSVVAGSDHITRVPGSRTLHRMAMDCDGQPIVITVLEKLSIVQAA